VIQNVEPKGIAYEVFAYYALFYGPNGVFQQQQNLSTPIGGAQNLTDQTATSGAQNATTDQQVSSGFL